MTGSLLNPQESPRKQYVIQAADGVKITLDAAQVRKVLRPKPDEAEYEQIAPTYADTAAAQWELAQWCREHKLIVQRQVHLRRVIELEPNHTAARHALGYSRVNGQWVTQEGAMTAQGFVRSGGKWMLPQEVELAENKRKLDADQQEWCQKLKRWRGWLGSNHDQEARDNIAAVNDPMAVKGLTLGLRNDQNAQARVLFVAALGRIDAPEAARAMAIASVCDADEEVRLDVPRPVAISVANEEAAGGYFLLRQQVESEEEHQRYRQPGGARSRPLERPVGHPRADRGRGHNA